MKFGQGVVIDEGCYIAPSASIWNNSVIRSNVEIGPGTVIGHLVVVERDTIIGKNTTVQSQCHITAKAIIGDNVFLGPGVVMTNERNIANQGRTEPKIEITVIENGARIGAACVILPGVHIGANAFVGAGSLITKSIPAGELWVGSPARYLRDVPLEEFLP